MAGANTNVSLSQPSVLDSASTSDRTQLELAEALNKNLNLEIAEPRQLRRSRSSRQLPLLPLFDSLTRTTLPIASLSHANSSAIATSKSLILSHALVGSSALSRHHNRQTYSVDILQSIQAQARSSTSGSLPAVVARSEIGLINEEHADAPAKQPDVRIQYRPTRHPVVFCHGLMGFDMLSIGPSIARLQIAHWRGIREALEAIGVELLMARVPATSGPAERAQVLGQIIAENFPGKKVHLIGHSMGGLDCRYLTTHLIQNLPFDVLSVTIISTPHHGTSFADYIVSTLGASRLPSFLSLINMLPDSLGGGSGEGFEALTQENMRKFNGHTPDVPGVHYFSWGAWYDPGLLDLSRSSQRIVLEREGPNDGLISVESAKWGTYLGTLENVAHHDLIGWTDATRYAWAKVRGRAISFQPTLFYLSMVDYLARVAEDGEVPERNEREAVRELDRKTDNTVNVEARGADT